MDDSGVVDITASGTAPPTSVRSALSSLTVRELLGYLAACESASRDGARHVSLDALSREQERIVAELRRRPADGTLTGLHLRLVSAAGLCEAESETRPRT